MTNTIDFVLNLFVNFIKNLFNLVVINDGRFGVISYGFLFVAISIVLIVVVNVLNSLGGAKPETYRKEKKN